MESEEKEVKTLARVGLLISGGRGSLKLPRSVVLILTSRVEMGCLAGVASGLLRYLKINFEDARGK